MSSSLLIEQLGKFHLVVVHFPVVLAMLLPAVMFVSGYPWGSFWRQAIPWFAHLAALSGAGATALGLLYADKRGALEGALNLHRTFGIASAVLLVAVSAYLLLAKPDLRKKIPAALWILVLAATTAVALTGHFGGVSVHGELIILGQGAAADEL